MRREVDATELDDVYLEQMDDEFADPIAADGSPAGAVATTQTTAPETDAPPAV